MLHERHKLRVHLDLQLRWNQLCGWMRHLQVPFWHDDRMRSPVPVKIASLTFFGATAIS
jgi:hypothetical protein